MSFFDSVEHRRWVYLASFPINHRILFPFTNPYRSQSDVATRKVGKEIRFGAKFLSRGWPIRGHMIFDSFSFVDSYFLKCFASVYCFAWDVRLFDILHRMIGSLGLSDGSASTVPYVFFDLFVVFCYISLHFLKNVAYFVILRILVLPSYLSYTLQHTIQLPRTMQ